MIGLSYLNSVFDDGGHTTLVIGEFPILNGYTSTPVGVELSAVLQDSSNADSIVLGRTLYGAINNSSGANALKEQRANEYGKYELIKS